MGSPPFALVGTVVTAISLSWVSSSVAAAPIVAATLVAFVCMPLLLVEAQLFSILLFIMFILVSCHDTVVSCFAVTISRHDFIVSRFAISLMWPSAPLASRADVGGTIFSGVESTLSSVEGTLGSVESTLGSVESTLGNVEGSSGGAEGILVDLQSAPTTTATDARAPALSLHRVEWQSGGSQNIDATMGAYRFRLSGSAGIAPCWVQT